MGKFNLLIEIEAETYLLPGWEVITRDPETETIIVIGSVINEDGKNQGALVELPQGYIRYPAPKNEVIKKVCATEGQIKINNHVVSTLDAVRKIKAIKGDFVITKEVPYTAVSFGCSDLVTLSLIS